MYSEGFQQQEGLANRHSAVILDTFCDKLQTLYGINVVPITNVEISKDP